MLTFFAFGCSPIARTIAARTNAVIDIPRGYQLETAATFFIETSL
ncbi:MAG TPA: hypothetical protein VL122_05165 [Nitrospirota bacterium]|nr:hypothetical protein [Nitrospirota bacterium]